MKMLNELNRAFIRNADYCKKKKKNQKLLRGTKKKIENSFAEIKTECKAMCGRLIMQKHE